MQVADRAQALEVLLELVDGRAGVIARFRDEISDHDMPIVVYGAAAEPQIPLDAALSLEEAGYRRVSCYLDGKDAWRDEGPDPETTHPTARIKPDVDSRVAGVDTPFAR